MSELIILGAAIGVGIIVALICDLLMHYGPRFTCYQKGHNKFYYFSNSRFPGEHAYWCGRCGRESSDEKDRRDIQIEPMFHVYSLRDFGMGRI
jgi:hypothetical protein